VNGTEKRIRSIRMKAMGEDTTRLASFLLADALLGCKGGRGGVGWGEDCVYASL